MNGGSCFLYERDNRLLGGNDGRNSAVALGLGCATGGDYRRRNHCCFRAADPDCGCDLGALARQQNEFVIAAAH